MYIIVNLPQKEGVVEIKPDTSVVDGFADYQRAQIIAEEAAAAEAERAGASERLNQIADRLLDSTHPFFRESNEDMSVPIEVTDWVRIVGFEPKDGLCPEFRAEVDAHYGLTTSPVRVCVRWVKDGYTGPSILVVSLMKQPDTGAAVVGLADTRIDYSVMPSEDDRAAVDDVYASLLEPLAKIAADRMKRAQRAWADDAYHNSAG